MSVFDNVYFLNFLLVIHLYFNQKFCQKLQTRDAAYSVWNFSLFMNEVSQNPTNKPPL